MLIFVHHRKISNLSQCILFMCHKKYVIEWTEIDLENRIKLNWINRWSIKALNVSISTYSKYYQFILFCESYWWIHSQSLQYRLNKDDYSLNRLYYYVRDCHPISETKTRPCRFIYTVISLKFQFINILHHFNYSVWVSPVQFYHNHYGVHLLFYGFSTKCLCSSGTCSEWKMNRINSAFFDRFSSSLNQMIRTSAFARAFFCSFPTSIYTWVKNIRHSFLCKSSFMPYDRNFIDFFRRIK